MAGDGKRAQQLRAVHRWGADKLMMRVPGMLETLCDGAQDRSAPELLAAVLRARPRAAGASVRTVFERPVAPASPSRHAGTGERSRATSWLHRPSRRYSAISLARGPSAPCTRLSRSPWGHRRHRRSQSAPAGAAAGATAPAPPRCSGSAEPQLSAFCPEPRGGGVKCGQFGLRRCR